MNIAIITAKSGGEQIEDKNTYPVLGRPLVAYPILAAQKAQRVAHTFVLTNSPEIRNIATNLGCSVIDEPPHLCTLDANHGDAIRYAVQMATRRRPYMDTIALLLGNTVMITPALIDEALNILENNPYLDSVMSVWRAADDHPWRALTIDDSGLLQSYGEKPAEPPTSRQLYPQVYFYDQGVWAFRTECVERKGSISPWWWMGDKCKPIVRPWFTGRDIHSQLDVWLSEEWLRHGK
jgi:CMP-N-acetylneuraminic acid synthetase